jgi:hypothetical protein
VKLSHIFWTWVFLPVTALAVAGELVASFDRSDATAPWTDYITTYLPPWLTFTLVGVLVAWLPAHFVIEYRKRSKPWPGI